MGAEPHVHGGVGVISGVRSPVAVLRRRYGAGPLHLLGLLASFAIAAAAVLGWLDRGHEARSVLEWFLAAIVAHDLVLVPLYTLLDRLAFGSLRTRARRGRPGAVNPTPYLRIPTMLSLLLLGVFFPVIFGLGRRAELTASGIAESGYLVRWLVLSAAMYLLAGVSYALAVRRSSGGRADE
jgi:hypothetical protein